jgi:hypothetical protein
MKAVATPRLRAANYQTKYESPGDCYATAFHAKGASFHTPILNNNNNNNNRRNAQSRKSGKPYYLIETSLPQNL